MNTPLFEDTSKCNAMHYLNEDGKEITRHEFVHELKDWAGVMLYVGTGFVKLTIAVLTLDDAKRRYVDEGAACEAFEDWCRETGREDEIADEDYECIIQRIPYPVPGYLFEDQHQDLKIYEGATAFYIEHIPSKEECCMGDGVDQEFYPGMVKADYGTLMDAYVPQHADD